MKTHYEKLRIPVSRLVSSAVVLLFLSSTSRWDGFYEPIALTLFALGMFLVAIGTLGRMWCSLYIAGYKDHVLIMQGPYSISRNPLYFFSAVGALGVGLCTETLTFPLIILGTMLLYYPLVIRKEEQRLRQRFDFDFEAYVQRVPVIFPKLSLLVEPDTYPVKPTVYRRTMLGAMWFVCIVGLIELSEGLKEMGCFPTWWHVW